MSYGIFTYIYHKHEANVGKYIIPMDPMGYLGHLPCNPPHLTNFTESTEVSTRNQSFTKHHRVIMVSLLLCLLLADRSSVSHDWNRRWGNTNAKWGV